MLTEFHSERPTHVGCPESRGRGLTAPACPIHLKRPLVTIGGARDAATASAVVF
jgi:hypothetical protein